MSKQGERIACRYAGCRGFIVFARTEKGRQIPLDAEPFPRDDVRRSDRFIYDHGAAVRDDRIDTAELVWCAHFATCPGYLNERAQAQARRTQPAIAARIESYRRDGSR